MSIILPKTKIAVEGDNPRSILLYGPEKVGKTVFASSLEGALLIDLEDGSDYVEAMKLKVNNLNELQQVGGQILKENCPYKYVIVDSLTELESWLEWEATEDYMNSVIGRWFNRTVDKDTWRPTRPKETPPTLPREEWKSVLSLGDGAGYLWLRIAFKRWHAKIKKLAPHIIYIGHMRDKIENKEGIEVTSKELDLTGKVRRIACQSVDAIGYMFRDKSGNLKISFVNNEELASGSRNEHLKGKIIDADWKNIFV
jgi:hypothetical protein